MPTSLSLPDLPIGQIVQGDVVLRNVVVSTAPSTRVPSQPTTQPAMPLDGSQTPRPPISGGGSVRKPSPNQYASDLVIPENLPSNAFSVLIDRRDNSIVKANLAETREFLQQDYYFIGAFDSATADAVIKDMIENPLPSMESLIDGYLDKAIPFGLASYMTGVLIFNAILNAKENWGNYVSFEDRVANSLINRGATPITGNTKAFPKSAVITVACLDGNTEMTRYDGIPMPKCLVSGLAVFRGSAYTSWANQPSNWSWNLSPQDMSIQLVTHPSLNSPDAQFILTNAGQEKALWDYITKLNATQPSFVFTLTTQSKVPFNVSLGNFFPQIQDKVAQYVALNEKLAELYASGSHVVVENVTPFTSQELVDLHQQGLATVQNAVNPNANSTGDEGDLMLYEHVQVNFSDGTSMETWKPIGKLKDYDCTRRGSEKMRDGQTIAYCLLSDGRKGYILKEQSFPTLVPSDSIIKATVNPSPEYEEIATIRDQLGQELGVPSGCTPLDSQVLPPSAVPPNCTLDVRVPDPLPHTPHQQSPVVQPNPHGHGGGGGGGGYPTPASDDLNPSFEDRVKAWEIRMGIRSPTD